MTAATMDTETAKAIQYAEKLLDAAITVVGAARVVLNENGARDPKVVGLTSCAAASPISALPSFSCNNAM